MIASAGSAVGSEVFWALALLVLSILVLLILRFYLPLRSTPAFVLVTVFFALWLPAGIVLLVPIDLASSAQTDDEATRGIWLPQRVVQTCWRIAYWLTFVLTWFTLPILAEYSDAGYREPKGKLMYSLRSNAQYYAMIFGFGILAFVYVLVSYGIHLDSLKSPVMALAYCWGLVLAIYLMGHGLVSIPRSLIRNASISGRLRRLQQQAPKLHEQMEDAETALEELENQVAELSRRKTGTALDFQDWIEELMDLTNLPEAQPRPQTAIGAAATRRVPTVITEKYMAELTRALNRARHARSRYVNEWNRLLRDAAKAQAILDCGPSKKLDFGRAAPHASWWERLTILTPYTRYLLHFHVMPTVRLGFGGLLALASACIIWSEIVKAGPAALVKLSVIRVSVVHHWTGDKGQVGFPGQLIAALWLSYMCAAALISITEVKVWRGRALVWRNTAHESAFWYASYVARLSVPLAYNFITFLSRDIYEKTTFYDFLGRLIDLTSLGSWFNRLFPLFILLPVCATLFGLYGKVKRTIGLADIIDEDEENELGAYGSGNWREGRDLIERELNGTSISRSLPGAAGSGDRSAAPIRSIPSAPNRIGSPSTPLGMRLGPRQQRGLDPEGDEEDDDNFFTSLGTRIKNTVDTIDTPKWLQEITKKPKWMDNEGNNHHERGESRWFGGNGGDGRIRL
ncbi:hypothetical protein M406DRAFT_87226 [Cryphonectria parasitica EP155]|uniref:Uncharacterized protein n=1 Tax=Cryphonectria parasitica (strain ATCC 38755 / EP155) TaxID=660469 RepID=A0A9P4YCZ7_CRYP1|nr:uncharacterized protein M406DRAFT_87226 [Cryphonectria parasitica EP155]KAF3770385.1 hypothetical protein M406DRAFT_87226 [Cryphonectria parasitica EP155]